MVESVVSSEGNSGRSWVVAGNELQYLVGGLRETETYGFSVKASTRIGEGPSGTRMSQRPRSDAPASIASFSQKKVRIL